MNGMCTQYAQNVRYEYYAQNVQYVYYVPYGQCAECAQLNLRHIVHIQ